MPIDPAVVSQAHADTPLSERRLPVLDDLRGLALLLVMQYHFRDCFLATSGGAARAHSTSSCCACSAPGWIFSTLASAVSLAIAWLSRHLLERPILGLKRYFP